MFETTAVAAERNREIVRLFVEEYRSYRDIGARFDITGERVRQILRNEGIEPKHTLKGRRKYQQDQFMAEHGVTIGALYEKSLTVAEISEALNLSKNSVHQVVIKLFSSEQRRIKLSARLQGTHRYQDEDLIHYVREAAKIEHPLKCNTYNRLAKANGWPSSQALLLRWDSWPIICKQAGIAPWQTVTHRPHSNRYSETECWDAVRIIHEELGHVPTITEYSRLARGRRGFPSVSIVRRRLGGWGNILSVLSSETDD